ncbi:hypothetical protein HU200_015416 [Digitaria exilis]|uniref:Uncharacterized protein n=1 Tax=Digitaria exilis TaxID=1010633 RepID=A0A835FAA5_9POAL|nr:hypothetical protein HU200_015416 [Digitaria exilis]
MHGRIALAMDILAMDAELQDRARREVVEVGDRRSMVPGMEGWNSIKQILVPVLLHCWSSFILSSSSGPSTPLFPTPPHLHSCPLPPPPLELRLSLLLPRVEPPFLPHAHLLVSPCPPPPLQPLDIGALSTHRHRPSGPHFHLP